MSVNLGMFGFLYDRVIKWDHHCSRSGRLSTTKGVDMRFVLFFLVLALVGISTDLGTSERADDMQLQPVIFAAALGSH